MNECPRHGNRAPAALVLGVPLLLSHACTDPSGARVADLLELDCSGVVQRSLIGASAAPSVPDIAARQWMTVGSLEDGLGATVCTGSLVREHWVLTAAHCTNYDVQWFRTAFEGQDVRARVVRHVAHEKQDIALMELRPDAVLDSATSFELWNSADGELRLDRIATLVGFGTTEDGESGTRGFLDEPIVEIFSDTLVVDGMGMSGACGGDSGGPLLVQDDHGRLKIAGILSTGSSDCVGEDVYQRTDALGDWIASALEAAADAGCGSTTRRGECLDRASARYCEDGRTIYLDCSAPTSCGYDRGAGGFRCVRQEDDACSGIDQRGICEEDAALRCDGGRLIRQDCGQCRQACITTRNGTAVCI